MTAPDTPNIAPIHELERQLIDIATRFFTGNYLQREGATLVASARECIERIAGLRLTPVAPSIDVATELVVLPTPVAGAQVYEEIWEPSGGPAVDGFLGELN